MKQKKANTRSGLTQSTARSWGTPMACSTMATDTPGIQNNTMEICRIMGKQEMVDYFAKLAIARVKNEMHGRVTNQTMNHSTFDVIFN